MSPVLDEVRGRPGLPMVLSEHDSKRLLAEYDIPVTRESLVQDSAAAVEAAAAIGYPVVLKASSVGLAHKAEADVIRLNLRSPEEVDAAWNEVTDNAPGQLDGVLVQEMVAGQRELVMGMIRDPQFGPCVMFGLGGIYTEVLDDVEFRIAPLTERDGRSMLESIRSAAILGPIRGLPEADRPGLVRALIALGQLGLDNDDVTEVDVNPVILGPNGGPVAVDAAVWLTAG